MKMIGQAMTLLNILAGCLSRMEQGEVYDYFGSSCYLYK